MDNLTSKKLDTLFSAIDHLLAEKGRIVMAIDGPCTAGKTTLSEILRKRYCCNIVHMDEFFLRPAQRTPERLSQPGGNVDYERFYSQVLQPMAAGGTVSYQPFSCAAQQLEDPITLSPTPLTVVEGTYSTHPYFKNPYDLTVFVQIDPQLQRQRVMLRPQWKHELFFNVWIPMEQQYFDTFSIAHRCDMIL